MAFNAFDHIESLPFVHGPDTGFARQKTAPDMFGKGSLPNYAQMKLARPSFKGTIEDLVMITNFKRFKRKGSSSRYKGVFYVKKEKKYRAQICLKGKKKYVGTFKNDRDAALARDKRIREMFGEVEELLNFPLSKTPDGNATTPTNHAANGIAPLLSNSFITSDQTNNRAANTTTDTDVPTDVNGSAANVIANVINGEELSVLKTKHEDQRKEDLFKEPPTPATTPAQNLQIGLPELKPRFSNLTRYGSSSSASLNFPYININGQCNIPNAHDAPSKADLEKSGTQTGDVSQLNQVGQTSTTQQSTSQSQFLDFPNSNFAIANTFKYNQMNSVQNGYGFPDQCQATPQQLIQGNYNGYNNYNNLVNLNFQDFSIPRPRAMLTKRFSSNDSCGTSLSFPLQSDPVLTPTTAGVHPVRPVQQQYSHMQNVSFNPLGETSNYAHTNSSSSNADSEATKAESLEPNPKRAKTGTAQ